MQLPHTKINYTTNIPSDRSNILPIKQTANIQDSVKWFSVQCCCISHALKNISSSNILCEISACKNNILQLLILWWTMNYEVECSVILSVQPKYTTHRRSYVQICSLGEPRLKNHVFPHCFLNKKLTVLCSVTNSIHR